jgi:hypothetical protein
LDPNSGFLAASGVLLDQWGFIVTGHDLVHSGERPTGYQYHEPALMGASAALMIREYLKNA